MDIQNQGSQVSFKAGQLSYNGRLLFQEKSDSPILFLGQGQENLAMYRGNFKIEDYVQSRVPLRIIDVAQNSATAMQLSFGYQNQLYLILNIALDEAGRLTVSPEVQNAHWNRLWLRLSATAADKIYGCGEQMSHFNLRGRHFPLWTSEPGVGRNKETLTTFWADVKDKAGGDYYTTNYPEPTFISTQKYYCHTTSYQYADFDFRQAAFHELQYWQIPDQLVFETADTFKELLGQLTAFLGRQPKLPAWSDNGLLLGVQGGTDRVNDIAQKLQKADVQLAGLWCQDWEGTRTTSFGKRNYWRWAASDELYPNLKQQIKTWHDQGLAFLSYINPYVVDDSDMFAQGASQGYFAKDQKGEIYRVDFGEFYCGVVDFTNPAAFQWFKAIIQHNLIDLGCLGWMADFGEYLPTDVVLSDGSDPMSAHNKWPMLWAKCNYEAVKAAGKLGEIVYFMRAGATGTQRYCPMLWAGDQSVNWSLDDGLASTIPAALSAGMTGNGLSHSDIGGYTSLHGNIRSKELFERWAEMGSFLPFMRSHEGNRPAENFQVYDDDEAIAHLAKCTQIFKGLTPYRQAIVAENHASGIPVQRPLFLEYEGDAKAYDMQYEYLFGPDVLVAPVYEAGQTDWSVYLPEDQWIHLWSGAAFNGGQHTVAAPIGQIPVFYRKQSQYADLFAGLTAKFGR